MNDHYILITGGSGQVGGALIMRAKAHGYHIHAPSHHEFDLADSDGMTRYFQTHQVDAIINCAAFTAVDKAEGDRETAFRLNALAPAHLAKIAAQRDIPLIHVSTDYVFAGDTLQPYRETDTPHPVNVYGASKLAGEQHIIASGCRYAIVRTSWVLSVPGHNFINTMLRLGAEQDEIAVVDDQRGCPTSADDLAQALLMLTQALLQTAMPAGLWHFANAGAASWYDLAVFIFEHAAAAGLKTPRITRITSADYTSPARRPANSVLDTGQFTRQFGHTPPPWQVAVQHILEQRLKG